MKIIHCADIHLDSKMSANMTKEKARERKTELLTTFQNMDIPLSFLLVPGSSQSRLLSFRSCLVCQFCNVQSLKLNGVLCVNLSS